MNKAVVDITNTLGVRVMSVDLNGPQGRRVLDLSGLPGGVYMYSIRCGEYTNTGKIVITK